MKLLVVIIGSAFTTGILASIPPQIPGISNRLIRRQEQESEGVPDALLPVVAGLDFDPKKYASDADWGKYTNKGEHLNCLMTATDQGAGFLIDDTRIPASAASPWTGDLKSKSTGIRLVHPN